MEKIFYEELFSKNFLGKIENLSHNWKVNILVTGIVHFSLFRVSVQLFNDNLVVEKNLRLLYDTFLFFITTHNSVQK